MKKFFSLVFSFFVASAALLAQNPGDNIKFNVQPPKGPDISSSVAEKVSSKVSQAIGRSDGLSMNENGPFTLVTDLVIDKVMESEGLVQEVVVVSGELNLSVVDNSTGNVVHSGALPLKATVTGNRDKALDQLASSIKPTDTFFVRFVRKAKEKIIAMQPPVETEEVVVEEENVE